VPSRVLHEEAVDVISADEVIYGNFLYLPDKVGGNLCIAFAADLEDSFVLGLFLRVAFSLAIQVAN